MRFHRVFFTICMSLLTPGITDADGLIRKLPDDGTWARFAVTETVSRTGGRESTTSKTLTISLVGTLDVEGERCRWIEIAMEGPQQDAANASIPEIDKLLIPARFLTGDHDPLQHVVRAWRRHPRLWNGRVLAMKPDEADTVSYLRQRLRGFLHEPPKDAKVLDTAIVKSIFGSVECGGCVGTDRIQDAVITGRGKTTYSFESTYTLRCHDNAPFGVVTWERDMQLFREADLQRSVVTKLKLVDSGNDAKTGIPGAQ